MYCGSKYGLTDEHIIPYGLWGNLVLPKSSCKPCAAITSDFERRVLRGFMHEGRIVGNSPSRRKKKRPKTVVRSIIEPGEHISVKAVPIDEAFSLITIPVLEPAGILSGRAPERGLKIKALEQVNFGKPPLDFLRDNGAIGLKGEDRVDVNAFVRMIAKIAYGLAVAEHGLFPRNETPLLPMILEGCSDASNWIGSGVYRLKVEDKKPMHALATYGVQNGRGTTGLAAKVKLFASSGCTGYEVVVRVPEWQAYAAQQGAAADSAKRRG